MLVLAEATVPANAAGIVVTLASLAIAAAWLALLYR